MPRDLLCLACLTVIPVETRSWAETMTLHVLNSDLTHPRVLAVLDVDAAFDGIVRHHRGLCRR
jgi:hypothetical protein